MSNWESVGWLTLGAIVGISLWIFIMVLIIAWKESRGPHVTKWFQ